MAVIAFEGTATKKIYKVGSLVQGTGGRVLKVNADGSFTDTKSGKVSVGSSQSRTAKFYSSVSSGGRSATAKTSGSPNVSRATAVVAGGGGGAGVAVEAVAIGGGSSVTAALNALRVGAFGGGFDVLNGGDVEYGKVTQVAIGGWLMPRDPGTSDAQTIEDAMGEADIWNPATGLALLSMNVANFKYGVDQHFASDGFATQVDAMPWGKDGFAAIMGTGYGSGVGPRRVAVPAPGSAPPGIGPRVRNYAF